MLRSIERGPHQVMHARIKNGECFLSRGFDVLNATNKHARARDKNTTGLAKQFNIHPACDINRHASVLRDHFKFTRGVRGVIGNAKTAANIKSVKRVPLDFECVMHGDCLFNGLADHRKIKQQRANVHGEAAQAQPLAFARKNAAQFRHE